jgi:subfamily B ATP-binding cassette protein MsbA
MALITEALRILDRRNRIALLAAIGLIVLNRLAQLILPASTQPLIDNILIAGKYQGMNRLLVVLAAAAVAQSLTWYGTLRLMNDVAQHFAMRLRQKLVKHLVRLPIGTLEARKTGEVSARVMSDADTASSLFGAGTIQLLGSAITAVLAVAYVWSLSRRLTVLALVGLTLLAGIARLGLLRIHKLYKCVGEVQAEVNGRLTETLLGMAVVKACRAEESECRVLDAEAERLRGVSIRASSAGSAVYSLVMALVGFTAAGLIWQGAREVAAGRLTIGGLSTFGAFLAFTVGPVLQLAGAAGQISAAVAALDRTKELLDQPSEDNDPSRTRVLGRLRGEISADNVWFYYPNGHAALRGVSFRAHPGTVTALVGPSGAGKSSLIKLLSAFYKCDSGSLQVDGEEIAEATLASYRPQVGLVPQDTFLFDGPISENVSLGHPNATPDEILSACRLARVDEFAERLPEGYATRVGERGVKLSGGQKQRIAIARAVLGDPRILLLDEATSSLDAISEDMIRQTLSHVAQGRTTFIIAHRLSTVRAADQILVFQSGKIVERGTHERLAAANGLYSDLCRYELQQATEETLDPAPATAAD